MQAKTSYNFFSQSSYLNSSYQKQEDAFSSRYNIKNQLDKIGKRSNNLQFRSSEQFGHNISVSNIPEQQKQLFTKTSFQSKNPFSKINSSDLFQSSYMKNNNINAPFQSSFSKQQQQQPQNPQNSLFFSQYRTQENNQKLFSSTVSQSSKFGLAQGFFEMDKLKVNQFSPVVAQISDKQAQLIQQFKQLSFDFEQPSKDLKAKSEILDAKKDEQPFLSSFGLIEKKIDNMKYKSQETEKMAEQNQSQNNSSSLNAEYQKQFEQYEQTISNKNNIIENQKQQLKNLSESINQIQQQLTEQTNKTTELDSQKTQLLKQLDQININAAQNEQENNIKKDDEQRINFEKEKEEYIEVISQLQEENKELYQKLGEYQMYLQQFQEQEEQDEGDEEEQEEDQERNDEEDQNGE